MAHIQDRGKQHDRRWRARYRAIDGKERSKTFIRKADADRWLRDQTVAIDRGDWIDPSRSRMTFGEFVPSWQAWAKTAQRPSTYALNMSVINGRLLPRFGGMPLGRISVDDVHALMANDRAKNLSTSSVRRSVIVLRSVLGLAVEHRRLAVNVAASVRLPADTTRQMRTLDHDQVIDLVRAHPPWFRPLIMTAAYCGLRWGELAGLAPDRVDLMRQTIRVERQLSEVNGKFDFGPPKTKAGVRSLTIPSTVADMLTPHLASEVVQAANLVFPTPTGKPLRRNNFRTVWRRVVVGTPKRPGLFAGTEFANLTFHELRHTAASLAIAAGAHPLTVKERLGHSSITVTMDRYGHMFPAQDEALAEALDARLRDALASDGEPLASVTSLVG